MSSTVAFLVIFVLAPLAGVIVARRLGVKSPTLVFATAFAGLLAAKAVYTAWGKYRLPRIIATPRAGDFMVFVGAPQTLRQRVSILVVLALSATFVTAVAYGIRALVTRNR